MLTNKVYKTKCYGNILLSRKYTLVLRMMWTTNYTINMKFSLFMMVVTLSNAGRIPRSLDTLTQHHFPNLRTVHHGHGATSYQNVDIKNHGKISIPQKSQTSHHYLYPEFQDHELQHEVSSVREVPYFIEDGSENHFFVSDDAEPYTSNNIDHIDHINNIEEQSAYYDHYEQEYDYGYQ